METAEHEKCLSFMSEILTVLTSTNEHEEVLHLIVDRIVRTYHCQTCAVVLIDPKTEYLSIGSQVGLSWTFCKAFRRKLATGAIGELLWTSKPIVISNASVQPALAEEIRLEHRFSSCLAVPIVVDHRALGYIYTDHVTPGALGPKELRLVEAFAHCAGLAINKAHLHEENMRLDRVDHESGVEKYGAFLERLRASMARAESFNESFGVMILDVDNFKSLSHTYGYETSSEFLKELGGLITTRLRHVDAAGRYGFDEFIVLVSNAGMEEAVQYAKDLRESIASAQFTKHHLASSVSIGVAAYPHNGRSIDDLVLTARHALLEAQRSGRNKVFHYLKEWHAGEPLAVTS